MDQAPKIVRQRLQIGRDPNHPDANLLNAFSEKALTQLENAAILRHLASCSDCRQVVVLAQPEIEATISVNRFPASDVSGWQRLRWLVWAACVVVVGVGIGIYQREQPVQNQINLATAPAPAVQASNRDALTAAPQVAQKIEENRPTISAPSAAPPPQAENSLSARRDSAPRAAFAGDAKVDASREEAFSKPVGPRWALTPDGVLQRSLDAGKSWQAIPVANGVAFRVIASSSSEVWIGGIAGALYHSSDSGQHWEQIKASANGVALTTDITAIEFEDAQHGRLSTSSETWTTADSGQTWQKQ